MSNDYEGYGALYQDDSGVRNNSQNHREDSSASVEIADVKNMLSKLRQAGCSIVTPQRGPAKVLIPVSGLGRREQNMLKALERLGVHSETTNETPYELRDQRGAGGRLASMKSRW